MRRATILLILTLLAGCKNVTGPFDTRRQRDRVDDPLLPIEEQKRRGSERLAIPEDDRTVGPPSGISRPDPVGLGGAPR
jgi:hypothetical protein